MNYISEVEAKDLLKTIRVLDSKAQRWSAETDKWRRIIERTEGEGGEATQADSEAYKKALERYEAAVDEYVDNKMLVNKALDEMDNVRYIKALELRYLDPRPMSMKEVAQELDYSATGIWNLHRRALYYFTKALNAVSLDRYVKQADSTNEELDRD